MKIDPCEVVQCVHCPVSTSTGHSSANERRSRFSLTVSVALCLYDRRVPDFELVTDLEPAGDQVASDRRAGLRAGGRRPVPDSPRHHRFREVVFDRQRDRNREPAHAGDGAEQDARGPARQRVPGAVPEEPSGVLRLLLRLLPARGLSPVDRHLHRERQLDQRRDRPAPALGHERAPVAPRRDHRGVGVCDLRARVARDVRQAAPDAGQGRRARSTVDPRAARRAPVRAQRLRIHPEQVPGARRHHRGVPVLRRARGSDLAVRRRGRADQHRRPADRRAHRGSRQARTVPGVALRHGPGGAAVRHRRHREGAGGASGRARGAGQAAGGAALADAHELRPRDAARGRELLRRRELFDAPRRAPSRAAAVHAPRLLPRRLAVRARRVARRDPAAARPVRG